MMKFFWDNFFVVVGDMLGVEVYLVRVNFIMYEVLFVGWGCLMGELFDLEVFVVEVKR